MNGKKAKMLRRLAREKAKARGGEKRQEYFVLPQGTRLHPLSQKSTEQRLKRAYRRFKTEGVILS